MDGLGAAAVIVIGGIALAGILYYLMYGSRK